jgi:hypothetical protein
MFQRIAPGGLMLAAVVTPMQAAWYERLSCAAKPINYGADD